MAAFTTETLASPCAGVKKVGLWGLLLMTLSYAPLVWSYPSGSESTMASTSQVTLPKLDTYVAELNSNLEKAASSTDGDDNVLLVMGNQSADLDSMVSAITYGYWLYLDAKLNPEGKPTVSSLIDIPRHEFKIRPEAELVIEQKGGLKREDLVFNDNPHVQELFNRVKTTGKCGGLQIMMVDHLALKPDYQFLAQCVRGIVDHHEDDGSLTGDHIQPRWVNMVGSATSLTTLEGYRLLGGTGLPSSANQPPPDSKDPIPLPENLVGDFVDVVSSQPNLANMLLAPILKDTSNMKEGGKVRPMDRTAAALIYTAYPATEGELPAKSAQTTEVVDMETRKEAYFKAWYDDISRAEECLDALSTEDLLKKDFKEWVMGGYKVGISYVTMPFSKWLDRDGLEAWEDTFKAYAANFDLFMIMTMNSDNGTRELLVYTPELTTERVLTDTNHDKFRDFSQVLIALEAADKLKLKISQDEPFSKVTPMLTKGYVVYDQLVSESSRKQVQPVVKDILEKLQQEKSKNAEPTSDEFKENSSAP
ncbi:hypothetical protein IWQ62_004264 [Dispira parvispora]|uniref:inorganic diphosphatase n=1 Tax=Dispira parvispora TaxID=1520584 RepID=A0A9W8E254_9FUNG|nr:hypothetical protein IWQ62_004264 [Dispira parvispora]